MQLLQSMPADGQVIEGVKLVRRSGVFRVGLTFRNGRKVLHPTPWQSLAGAQAAATRFESEGVRAWKALL